MFLRRLLLLVFFFFFSLSPCTAYAKQPLEHSLFVLLVPGLNLDDLSGYHNLKRLAETSGVGLVNSTGAGGRKITSSYLSLSAGTKATCPAREGNLGFQRTEDIDNINVLDIYRRLLGRSAGNSDIVMPYFHTIINANKGEAIPGLLGDTLQQENIPFIFMGNHDLPGTKLRPGALIAADGTGKISRGYVDRRTYITSAYSPTHYTTNYTFLLDKTVEFLNLQNGIVFLDLADLVRLDSLSDTLPPEVFNDNRQRILTELDVFLGRIMELGEISILLVTPYPSKEALNTGNSLTPVIYHTLSSNQGLLSSASTKRPGVITNLDIGPAILQFAGITPPPAFVGSPLRFASHSQPLGYLQTQLNGILVNYRQRPILLKGYVLLQIIVVLSVIALILLHHPLLCRMSPFLLALTTGPLLFLLLPLLPVYSVFWRTIILLITAGVIVALLETKVSMIIRLSLMYLLTAGCIAGDLLLGAPLMKTSLLGYDAISGARYYGLGNEYMGVLLGSSLIGSTLLVEFLIKKYPQHNTGIRTVVFLALTGLIFLIAAPQWGTNVGGTIAFTGSIILLALLLWRKKIDLKTMASIGLCCASFIALLFYADLQRPVEVQSHIGLTARLIREQGLSSLFPIITRKVNMNIKLLHYSLWTRVFLTFLGATALIFYKPPGLLKKIFYDYPYLKAGFIAGLSGSFIALFVNDSGIVAAATSSIFVVPTLLYLITKRTPL